MVLFLMLVAFLAGYFVREQGMFPKLSALLAGGAAFVAAAWDKMF